MWCSCAKLQDLILLRWTTASEPETNETTASIPIPIPASFMFVIFRERDLERGEWKKGRRRPTCLLGLSENGTTISLHESLRLRNK